MRTFICKYRHKSWHASILNFKNHGTHSEFKIQSTSNIFVIFGKSSFGYYAFMPDFKVCSRLENFNDIYRNSEKLSAEMGTVDGITVATALLNLYKELCYPEF